MKPRAASFVDVGCSLLLGYFIPPDTGLGL